MYREATPRACRHSLAKSLQVGPESHRLSAQQCGRAAGLESQCGWNANLKKSAGWLRLIGILLLAFLLWKVVDFRKVSNVLRHADLYLIALAALINLPQISL